MLTKKEFLEQVIANVEDVNLQDYARLELKKLEEANARKRNKVSQARAEINEPLKATILEKLEGKDFTLAKDIATMVEVSPQKAMALLKQLADEGKVEVTDVKVKGSGVRKAFKLA